MKYRSIKFKNAEISSNIGLIGRLDSFIYILSKDYMQVFDENLRNLLVSLKKVWIATILIPLLL